MDKVVKIIEGLERYEVISFDIFDTLIKRNVKHPEDIFSLVEIVFNNREKEKIQNFKEVRIKAYYEAAQKNKNCNLDDIYKEIEIFANFFTKI